VRKVEFVVLIAFFGLSSAVFADQITLKNGDHLTGTVVKSDGKTLVLHTEFAGDVTVDFKAITQITTDKELHVTTSDKKTIVGPVTTSDGKIEVATKTGGTVEVSTGNVALIRNDAEQAAYDQSLHPGLLHGWNGGANVGFSLARGNSQTSNLALAINAVHATLNDKITIYTTSIETNNELATPSTVANLVTAGIRYDRNINPRMFGFVGADFMSNALQDLDLRGVYGGGLGYHAIKSANTTRPAGRRELHPRDLFEWSGKYAGDGSSHLRLLRSDEQIRRAHPGRRTDAQGGKNYGDHGETLHLSRPVERI